MKKLLVLLVAVMFLVPLQANAQGFPGMVRAYQAGVAARQQEDMNDQQLRMMQEEAGRIRAEREYLESLRKQTDQQQRVQEDAEQKAKNRKMALLEAFEKNVKPRIVRVHPDFDSIMKSKAYWIWAEAQEPDLKRCAMDSPDAADIIYALSEYKKAKKWASK